ncbi:hypothetical protein JRQ81_006782 [Phrynocephalus forsythii]|uniref:SEA domain-containing protein n=1 Tax=Phrynocephalus forsythii TaxID=171643 RepID=A0A9Q0XE40_9SAUR|nr:hypothetical protein JRQ81_006782 [Phrynocephalus forsythii]
MNLYTISRITNDVRATDQSHTVNAHLDSAKSFATAEHGPEHYKEGLLNSNLNYGIPTAGTLTAQGQLSQIAQDSTPYQPSVVDTTRQWSQLSKATVGLPSTKEHSFVGSHHSMVEFIPDLADSSITQLANVMTTPVPDSRGAGLPGFSLSLATYQPNLSRTALGIPTEVNLFPRQQSSEPKEHLTSPDGTSLSLYLGSTKEHKDSSLAAYDMPETSLGEGLKTVLKEGPFHVGEDHTGPHVFPTHDIVATIKSGTTSFGKGFLSWEPPTLLPPGTRNSEDVRNDSYVPQVEVSPSNAVSSTVGYKEIMNNAVSRRKEEFLTAALERVVISDLPPTTSGDAPTVRLASSLISEEPETWLADHLHTLSGKASETTASILVGSALVSTPRIMVTSKGPSKQDTLVASLTTKKAHKNMVHILTPETEAALVSHPYPNREDVTLPMRATFTSMAYANMQSGSPTVSPVVEFLSKTSPGWKSALPTSSHDIASPRNLTEPPRTSVVPTHSSSSRSFASLGSASRNLPATVQKIITEDSEHLLARKEHVVPMITKLPSSLPAEVWWPSSPSSPTIASTAPLLPTKIPDLDLDTSAVAPTEGLTLRYNITDGSAAVPLTTGEASLHIPSPDVDSKFPVPLSITEAQSTQVVPMSSNPTASVTDPKSLPVELTSTASMPCSHPLCMIKTPPASFTPSHPLLTQKVLVSMLASTEGRKNTMTSVNVFEVTIPKEISTRALLSSGKTVTLVQEEYTLEERVSKLKNLVLGRSARKEHLTPLGSSVPAVSAVHTLPLWFRLTGVNYTESLENKSSEIYKKLEKEVKLTLNKMLSAYETFLQTNVLGFLNGSVMVLSEAMFRAGPAVPTPSDTIRTIVTEVETKGLDAFFDWRIDLPSLRSDGFHLGNLEPEKLSLSFTVLSRRPQPSQDYLETLRNKVTSLLGARYTVLNISLVEVRNLEGDIDVSGEVYADTDMHVDIAWALEALMGLSNDSVDLTSLSINGSRLSLHVFPVSFLVTNRVFNEKMMDRSSAEHQDLARDLVDVLMHILSQYKNFLQVAIRHITGGSLVCRGDVIFQHPAPSSKDVLRTLSHSVGPKGYLDSSGLQVDPFSFTVAGDGLEPPFENVGIPGYGIGVIILCVLLLVVLPILALLPKIVRRKEKAVINNRAYDPEAGVETFELDNPTFRSPGEEVHVDCLSPNVLKLTQEQME